MPDDDYQYQTTQLPPYNVPGGDYIQDATNFGTTPPRLGEPAYTGGEQTGVGGASGNTGGGGTASLLYITDASGLVVGTGSAGTAGSVSVVSSQLGDGLITLSNASSVAILNIGATNFQLSVTDYNNITGITGVVQLRSLDVCHMGAQGLRAFVASEAWAP